MKHIDTVDEAVLDATPEVIYEALVDECAARSRWWMPKVELIPQPGVDPGHPGAVLEAVVHGNLGPHYRERLVEAVPGKRLRFAIEAGDFAGESLWTFETVGSATRVRHELKAEPRSRRMRVLSYLMDLGRAQSRLMQRGFDGLRRHVRELQQDRELATLKVVRVPNTPPQPVPLQH